MGQAVEVEYGALSWFYEECDWPWTVNVIWAYSKVAEGSRTCTYLVYVTEQRRQLSMQRNESLWTTLSVISQVREDIVALWFLKEPSNVRHLWSDERQSTLIDVMMTNFSVVFHEIGADPVRTLSFPYLSIVLSW